MRYFSYNELVEPGEGCSVVTVSEEDIRREYFPCWEKTMIDKYGETEYNKNWSFQDCLEDWIVSNWAWEVKDED